MSRRVPRRKPRATEASLNDPRRTAWTWPIWPSSYEDEDDGVSA